MNPGKRSLALVIRHAIDHDEGGGEVKPDVPEYYSLAECVQRLGVHA